MTSEKSAELLELTADIVSSHVGNNSVALSDLPVLIANVHAALSGLGAPIVKPETTQEPAVTVRASVKPDYLVCLEDGKKLKMLKRYLMTTYQMTPDQYRTKWKLPSDYPMVAPNYAATRKELALKIGLGRKAKVGPEAPVKVARKARVAKTAPAED
jgi:predicted transcriptional regulator